MIKSVSVVTRKAGMSVEDFQSYWRDVHGPLVARAPGVRRYIQSHTLPELYNGEKPPDYDGIVEIWWDSREAMDSARTTSEMQAAAADSANFIGESIRLLTTEVPLIDAFASPRERQGMVKYVAFLMKKDGVPIEEFQRHWRDVHGPINVQAITTMRRYVQTHVLPESFAGDNPPPFAGLPEAWFDSVEAFRGRPRDPNAPRDERWADVCSGQKDIFTREVIIVD
jgi:uncharacterized protein (TIGR02118 family)